MIGGGQRASHTCEKPAPLENLNFVNNGIYFTNLIDKIILLCLNGYRMTDSCFRAYQPFQQRQYSICRHQNCYPLVLSG